MQRPLSPCLRTTQLELQIAGPFRAITGLTSHVVLRAARWVATHRPSARLGWPFSQWANGDGAPGTELPGLQDARRSGAGDLSRQVISVASALPKAGRVQMDTQ
jgi:hypothetical protein